MGSHIWYYYTVLNKKKIFFKIFFIIEGSLSNTLNEKNSFPRAHNTRGRHSSLTMDTVRDMALVCQS